MKKLFLLFTFSRLFFASAQWTPQNSGTNNFLPQIFFLSKDTGYVVQDDGVLRRTTNGGINWNLIYSGSPQLADVTFASYLNGNAIGSHGILQTVNGGMNWSVQYVDSNLIFNSIFAPTATIGYATAWDIYSDSTYILKTINSGTSWSIVNSALEHLYFSHYNSIFFLNKDTGYIGMDNGPLIAKTFNGGVSWQFDTLSAVQGTFYGIYFLQDGTGYVCGIAGEIFKTTDYGNIWIDVTDVGNSGNPLYSIVFVDDSTGYVVGGDGFSSGIILSTVNGGTSWINVPFLTQTYNSVVFPSANIGYTCGTGGSILKYDGTLNINENINSTTLIYPNPCGGVFRLKSKDDSEKSILVLDILGNTVWQQQNNSNIETTIDISHHPKGIYFVKIAQGDKISTQKIVLM